MNYLPSLLNLEVVFSDVRKSKLYRYLSIYTKNILMFSGSEISLREKCPHRREKTYEK